MSARGARRAVVRGGSRFARARLARAALAGALALLVGAAAAAAEGGEGRREARPNLLENGDFEKGKGPGPDGWERPDELTTTWVDAPGRKGRCIRIDTDVLASQYRERRDVIEKALAEGKEPPPPPKRLPTRPPKYDTVAGLDGVSFASREVPIRAGGSYRLSADAMVEGAASPRVWVKALREVKSSSGVRERVVWKKALVCEGAGREWKTFSMTFPSRGGFPEGVRKLRVELYAYWPPGVYHFDDVRLEEIPRTEAAPAPRDGAPAEEESRPGRAADRPDRGVERAILWSLSFPGALFLPAAGACALAGAPGEEPAPEWYEGFELRRKILFGRSPSAGDAVLLRAGTSRATRADARDVRVVLDHRQPLPLDILEVGPGDTVLLRFEVPSPAGDYYVYLGNPNAARPRRPPRAPVGGLLLEVRELAEGSCGSWPEMRRLLEASREVVGHLAPRRIFLGIPPLGKTGGFVARYGGFLRVAEAGTYTFETASEGGSFVLVGGKLVASWPGFHGLPGVADPREREKRSGSARLDPGVYPIEYVVASKSGCVHVLAWRKEEERPKESALRSGPEREAAGRGAAGREAPGRGASGREAAERERRTWAATRPIPEAAFVPWLPASLGPVETRKGPFADFDWEVVSDSGSDAERHDLAEIAFRFSGDLKGRGARRTRWDFGDGQSAEGSEVRHVYLRHGAYEVSVEVEVSEGARLRATRTVAARFESLERTDLDRLLERYHEATRGYDLERLPPEHLARLVWLRSKDADWKEDLAKALEAWYRRGLALGGPETQGVERLGLERARELLRRSRSEPPAERGGLEALARRILEVLGSTAASEERREEARVRLAALDLGGEPARAEAAEGALRELAGSARTSSARRRAAIALADRLVETSREKEAREALERLDSPGAPGTSPGDRALSSGARSLSFDHLLQEKRFEEAEEELERWEWELPLEKLTGALGIARARLLLARGRAAEALRELDRVASLEGAKREAPRALLIAAEALEARGDRAGAAERLQRLAREFPQRPEGREAAERLGRAGSPPSSAGAPAPPPSGPPPENRG